MKITRLQYIAVVLSCVGMLTPAGAFAGGPVAVTPTTDIALQNGGLLIGQMFDAQGAKQAGKKISIVYDQRQVVETVTDENGVFAATGLPGGQYELIADSRSHSIRAWAPGTAPPNAREGGLIVAGDQIVRGNIMESPRWCIEWIKCHPWLATTAILAAVAIPIAIAADDDDNS